MLPLTPVPDQVPPDGLPPLRVTVVPVQVGLKGFKLAVGAGSTMTLAEPVTVPLQIGPLREVSE